MPSRIIDEMPTLGQVQGATAYEVICWHHYLRPTMMNEELDIVKAIARKYDAIPESARRVMVMQARREYER